MPLAYGIVESVDVALPSFPQTLDGFRIAHVSDLHTDRRTKRLDRMIYQLAKIKLDLGVLTGDYMIKHRGLGRAMPYLRELVTQVRPALGWYGVFGNHDWAEFTDQAADLPVRWLRDEAVTIQGKPIDLLGLHMDAVGGKPDPVAAALSVGMALDRTDAGEVILNTHQGKRFRLALTHKPDHLTACSDLGADLVLAGHTHGGQVRLPFGPPLHNSSDLPLTMSSGLLRHRDTLCLITRGVGSTPLAQSPIKFRIFCPPHVPVYTLRQGSMPGEYTDDIRKVWGW
ncbi:MAG: metallophosphoesterase [Planctomycetota bacterium]